jgi:microcystin-dependent protein
MYQVGSIYINATNATNPGTLFGFGTWVAFGAGRVPVGFDSSNVLFDTAEETGGSANAITVSHTHTVTDPGHAHGVYAISDAPPNTYNLNASSIRGSSIAATNSAVTGISIDSAGSSGTNANYQPYITVYMWKRTV